MATQITPHFTYEPFWNNSSTAKKYGIDNRPDAHARANIYKIVRTILEPIAIKYGKPIRVNSSYRCPRVNQLVGGSKTSQHVSGAAVDIAANGGGGTNAQLFQVVLDMIKSGEITVGQLIWEYGSNSNPQWVHVSLPYSKVNQVLRCIPGPRYIPYDPKMKLPSKSGSSKTGSSQLVAGSASGSSAESSESYGAESTSGSRADGISLTVTRSVMSSPRAVGSEYKKK